MNLTSILLLEESNNSTNREELIKSTHPDNVRIEVFYDLKRKSHEY